MGSGEKLALSNDNTGLVPVFGSSLKLEGIELSYFPCNMFTEYTSSTCPSLAV